VRFLHILKGSDVTGITEALDFLHRLIKRVSKTGYLRPRVKGWGQLLCWVR
jgi:hypothetical protein